MEEDQEVIKHVCRICSKNFPCGRSLGGHMRSHDHVKTNDHHHHDDDESFVAVASASTSMKKEEGCSEGYYGLRENPKKTWRVLTDSTSDDQETFDVVLDKLCKECGKGFQSWKALFGHMKCHSHSNSKINNGFELDEHDPNAAVLPNRKRRSKRRLKTRYMNCNTSSSVVNFAANSVSEVDEQEEVAMSLMMLSRDVRSWCGLNSVAESSNNDDDDNNESLEIVDDESKGNDKKKTRVSVIESGKDKKKNKMKIEVEVDSDSAFEVNLRSKSGTTSTSKAKYTSMKEKFYDSETKVVTSEVEFGAKKSRKRGKFECTTCNRTFLSYQALGGHRASHKRTKGCFASKVDQNGENENSAELELELEMEVDMKINVPAEGRMLESEGVVEEVSEIRNFLDLNLPAASSVDERNGHSEIYTWWLDGSNFKQEAMVGLLSN